MRLRRISNPIAINIASELLLCLSVNVATVSEHLNTDITNMTKHINSLTSNDGEPVFLHLFLLSTFDTRYSLFRLLQYTINYTFILMSGTR